MTGSPKEHHDIYATLNSIQTELTIITVASKKRDEASVKRDEIIQQIHRALYGDEKNDVQGLISKQKRDDVAVVQIKGMKIDIEKNTLFRKKITKTIIKVLIASAIGGSGGGYLLHFLKEAGIILL